MPIWTCGTGIGAGDGTSNRVTLSQRYGQYVSIGCKKLRIVRAGNLSREITDLHIVLISQYEIRLPRTVAGGKDQAGENRDC